MPETVEFLKEQGYIRIQSFGETSLKDWNSSLEKVLQIYKNTGNKNVLVDVREQRTTPVTLDILEFGENLPLEILFAIVASGNTKNNQKFLETVGKTRGKSIQLFKSYEEGVTWLKSNA